MIRGILIAVLALGVAGTAFWGYQEHRDKNVILLNAENNYQRAFHDLSYQMNLLHDKIGTTLAMNSRQSLSPALATVWRIASQAHSDVGQLPLTLMPFNKTEEFLAKIGDFSYRTAVRDLDKKPLSKQEYKTLNVLYQQSGELQNQLRKVQRTVLNNNLRWMDVENALASGRENTDNMIIDGFKTVENTVSGYDVTDLGPTFANIRKDNANLNKVQGKFITRQEAVNIAKKYIRLNGKVATNVSENGKGSNYGFYSVTFKSTANNEQASMDITKKGGYPIWLIDSRTVSKQTISLHEAGQKAELFLKNAGYKNMVLFESAQYDNVGVFDFVTSQNNVRIYPESIKVKVALDNGEMIGFTAEEYLTSHQSRKLPSPAISIQQAKSKVNPNVKIMEEREAVITNSLHQDVLCYEFLGVMGRDTYRILINAENGKEEEVQKLKPFESKL